MTTTPATAKYEYELELHCLPANEQRSDADDEESGVTRTLRRRTDKIRSHLLGVADTVDKLVTAGWTVDDHPELSVLLCWRDDATFSSEAALREHLGSIAVAADANFLEIVPVRLVEAAEDPSSDDESDDDESGDDLDNDDLNDDLSTPGRRLYLVRWQNLSAALVMAHDENDLLDILDEEADTTACSWWEYDGPLFLDFTLPIEWRHADKTNDEDAPSPVDPERWVPENICITRIPDDVLDVKDFDLRLAGNDTVGETEEKLFELAFPRLHEVFFGRSDDHDCEGRPPADKVAAAARDEVARTMREHRRVRQATEQRAGAGDREASIALMMGTSSEQAQNMNANNPPPELPAEQPLPPLVPPPEETGN